MVAVSKVAEDSAIRSAFFHQACYACLVRNHDDPKSVADLPLLERLTFLIELNNYPPERRPALITKRGFTVEQIERWKTEARKRMPHLPPPKSRPASDHARLREVVPPNSPSARMPSALPFHRGRG